MSYYDDYDDYIAEEEEKINAIIDEQAIYDIASKKVKEKLDELKQTLKDSESVRKRLAQEISELEKGNKDLKTKISELEKEKAELVVYLTEEQIKEGLRKRNPWGLTEGDTCYYVDYHYIKNTCPICNGEKKITLGGEKFKCPKCNERGYLSKTRYEVKEKIVKRIYFEKDYDNVILTKIEFNDNDRDCFEYSRRSFKDKESAEKLCKELNDKAEKEQ